MDMALYRVYLSMRYENRYLRQISIFNHIYIYIYIYIYISVAAADLLKREAHFRPKS